jgi:hypothetical protein
MRLHKCQRLRERRIPLPGFAQRHCDPIQYLVRPLLRDLPALLRGTILLKCGSVPLLPVMQIGVGKHASRRLRPSRIEKAANDANMRQRYKAMKMDTGSLHEITPGWRIGGVGSV